MSFKPFRVSGDWALDADDVQWIICQRHKRKGGEVLGSHQVHPLDEATSGLPLEANGACQ